MPEEENKKLSLIKFIWSRPEGQRLATASMLVVIFLVGVINVVTYSYYKALKEDVTKCENGYKTAEKVIDSLKSDELKKSEDINKRLQARVLWEDSVKQQLQILLYKK
jgi:predicted negative regulator of RcsB-dependent stress response